MALFKYLRHLMCIGYTSLFLYKQSKKYCLGFWELQSLARMKYHSISNKTSGYIGFIFSLCCWTHLSYELSETSLTLLVFPFEGSQVCWMKFPHNLWCTSISPCHKEGTNEWEEKSLTSLCSIQKKNSFVSYTLKKSMQPFSVHGFPLFYSKWGWEVRSM